MQTKRVGVNTSINLSKMTKHFIWELYNKKAHLEVDGVNKKEIISVLSKANHVLDSKALHPLYCSLVLPYLNYCLDNWESNDKCSL